MFNAKPLTHSVLALTAGMLLHTAVQAQEYDTRPNIYAGGVYHFIDSDVNQEDDLGALFGAELPVSNRLGATLERWLVDTDNDNGPGDAELTYTRIGGNYHLTQHQDWQPYLSAGLGYWRLKESMVLPMDLDEPAFDFGVGVKRFIGEHFFFRGDAKLIRVQGIHTWDQTVSIGLGYAFGPRNTAVAAAPAPAPAPAAPADPDTDGDGVSDSRDKCAATPRNLAVDADGCPILESSQMRQQLLVNFDFDQAVVKTEFYDEIEAFADFMATYANTSVVIEGHTDSDGTEAYNQGLSERRATAVMDRLVSTHGIAASRLSAVGFGEARPVVANDSAENKLRNRRIEADVGVQVEQQRQR